MRSALDHLVFEVVRQNPNISSIDPEWEQHCEFPLWTKPLKPGQKAPLPKRKFSRQLPGISDATFVFIESVQPYYGVGTVNNALRFLAHLSNIDKHRRLNLMCPRIHRYESIRYPSGLSSRGYSTLDRGAEIYPTPPQCPLSAPSAEPEKPMYVKRHYRTLVTFDERPHLGNATGLRVDYLLDLILGQIKTVIVPAFERFIKKP